MSIQSSDLRIARLLRTPTSERLIFKHAKDEVDLAVLDIHYLASGQVAGNLFIYENAGLKETDVAWLLSYIDEDLLPEASLQEGSLIFAVTMGRFLGNYERDVPTPTTAG